MSNFATTLPFGEMNITHLFNVDTLKNVGRRSSRWQIIEAFLRTSEGTVERLCEGKSGVLIMVGIPGRKDTGALYLYDEKTHSFYMMDFEYQETFNAMQFDSIVNLYDLARFTNIAYDHKPAKQDKTEVATLEVPAVHKRNRNSRRYRGACGHYNAHSVYNQSKAQAGEVAHA
jgi:hypothetical protein